MGSGVWVIEGYRDSYLDLNKGPTIRGVIRVRPKKGWNWRGKNRRWDRCDRKLNTFCLSTRNEYPETVRRQILREGGLVTYRQTCEVVKLEENL